MNERCQELQALHLLHLFSLMPWPDGWGLRKIDGVWRLLPAALNPKDTGQ